MTEQDLEQVREALTDAVLNDAIDAWWDAGALNPMRDRLLAALAPLVRPAPTCGTCQHDTDYAECRANWRRPIQGMYWKKQHGCSLHTPRPSTPEGSAKS